jgi:hypothetical protein
VPRLCPCLHGFGQVHTVGVSACQSAEIVSFPYANAGDKKAHIRGRDSGRLGLGRPNRKRDDELYRFNETFNL